MHQGRKPGLQAKKGKKSGAGNGDLRLNIFRHVSPLIVSIIIVYALIILVYLYTPSNPSASISTGTGNFGNGSSQQALQHDKQAILDALSSRAAANVTSSPGPGDRFAFVVGNSIDTERLREFASKNYSEMKAELGIQNDFCIHFEDGNGNAINISSLTGTQGIGIGSTQLYFTLVDSGGRDSGTVMC